MSVEQLAADPDQLLTARQAADLCQCSVWTINDKAKQGMLRRVNLGGHRGIRYRRTDLIAFIEAHLED